ncbi:MAG: DMT family transporter, partial [Chromatiales bacterium]|nr:DMT family transporter [Chromatiales bacterium]
VTGNDRRTLIAVGWMAFAMSGIGFVDAIAKWLGQTLAGVQVVWGYFFGMLLALTIHVLWSRKSIRRLVTTRRPVMQMVRAACLVSSLSFLFVGLQKLPLAETTAISFTSPLFIVALAGPFLGEHVSLRRWMAVVVGMSGALLVVRPGTEIFQWAAFLPMIGAFFFALFSICTRKLNGEDPLATLFFTFAGGTAIASLVVPFVWAAPTAEEILIFLVMGTAGALSHVGIVRAMRDTDASIVAPLNYVRLIWALGLGFMWFDQWPDSLALAGAAVIVASGVYVAYGASTGRLSNS